MDQTSYRLFILMGLIFVIIISLLMIIDKKREQRSASRHS